MAIKLITVKCPACGADLNIEEGRKQLFCSYCGTKVIIDNDNEYIYRHIDEASIKQTEADTMLRIKALELEEKENERSRKGRKVAYTIAALFVIIGILILFFNSVGIWAIIAGGLIASLTYISNDNKKKRSRIISENETVITEKMLDYEKKNINSIVALYQAAGFKNVNAVPLCDLNIFTAIKNGQVDDVTINGDNDFDEGEVFPKSASVIITYHST